MLDLDAYEIIMMPEKIWFKKFYTTLSRDMRSVINQIDSLDQEVDNLMTENDIMFI